MMTGGLVWPGNSIFSLSCAAILAKSLKTSLLTSSVRACGRPQWRRFYLLLCSVLSLISCDCKNWYDTSFFFLKGDEMIWQCLHCFQNIIFLQLSSTLFTFFFFSLHLFLVYGFLVGLSRKGQQRQLQCPLPGFCPVIGIPFCNPYLIKALTKSTMEIKAVKLVKLHLFG